MCLHRVDPSGAVHQVVRERDSLPTTVGAAGQVLRVSSGVRGKKFDEIRRRMFAASFGERDLKQPHTPLRCSASMESLSGHSASRAQSPYRAAGRRAYRACAVQVRQGIHAFDGRQHRSSGIYRVAPAYVQKLIRPGQSKVFTSFLHAHPPRIVTIPASLPANPSSEFGVSAVHKLLAVRLHRPDSALKEI